ncbi:MAG TPA: hypothetical protein EYO73_11085 [Sulfurimonas sp.]|nr:hypothetical protein [Sulfurimonas sp.]
MTMGPNNELFFEMGVNGIGGGAYEGNIIKLNFNTDTFTKYHLTNAHCSNPLVFDSSGNLYAEGNAGFVCKIDFSSNTVTTWDLGQTETGGVSFDYFDIDQNNNIFASIQTHQKIAKVDQSSNLVTVWLIPDAQEGPFDIAADSSGNVFFQAGNKFWRLVPATDTFTKWDNFAMQNLDMDGNTLWGFTHNAAWKLT